MQNPEGPVQLQRVLFEMIFFSCKVQMFFLVAFFCAFYGYLYIYHFCLVMLLLFIVFFKGTLK